MADLAYRHDLRKFSDQGLNLRLPVDSIPPGQYSRLNNVVADIEGQLETRAPLTAVATVSAGNAVHTIFRLNQQTTAVSPERLVGVGTSLYTQQLPSGAFSQLSGLVYDGSPLTIVPFRFDGDPSSWAILANSSGMRKRRRSLYQILGLVPPTAPATAADGGAGNLNSTGGPGYDWRATYVNSVTKSESNPSAENTAQGQARPTSNTNPDPTSGGSPCLNPANAYDNNVGTYAEFDGIASSNQSESCLFNGWAAGGAVSSLFLNVDSDVTVAGTSGYVIASLFYSTDGGSTWNTLFTTQVSRGRVTDSVALPAGTDLTKIQVRGVAFGQSTEPPGGFPGGGGGDTGGGGGGRPSDQP